MVSHTFSLKTLLRGYVLMWFLAKLILLVMEMQCFPLQEVSVSLCSNSVICKSTKNSELYFF